MTDANGRTTEEGPLAVMVGRADNDGSGSGGDGDNLAVRTHETGGNLAGRQRHALAATCIYKCDRAGAPRAAEVAACARAARYPLRRFT